MKNNILDLKFKKAKPISKWLHEKFGGKWSYDNHGSWWCDDNLRHVSRYSNLDEYENVVGPPEYCLYSPNNTEWIYPE